jgi:hypothetical protein
MNLNKAKERIVSEDENEIVIESSIEFQLLNNSLNGFYIHEMTAVDFVIEYFNF